MNRFFMGAALAMFAGPVLAADLAVPFPVYKGPPPVVEKPVVVEPIAPRRSWSGCFAGANIGGGWLDSRVVDEVSGAPIASLRDASVVGGGHIGCDFEITRHLVIGVQGMFEGSGIRATTTSAALDPLTLEGKIPWIATATARLGVVAAPNWLVYVKGGGAWIHPYARLLSPTAVVDKVNFSQWGWTAGGGIEVKLSRNWSIFAEYDYLGLRDKTVSFPNSNNVGTVRDNVQIGLVGFNYRFDNGAFAPLY